jgi:predicted nucleotidyltransferase
VKHAAILQPVPHADLIRDHGERKNLRLAMHAIIPTMDLAGIREKLATLTEQLSGLRIEHLSVFGSVVRGEARDQSDIDFLVQFRGPATFSRYMELKELLEREFQAPVDLVTVRALKPALRDNILEEAVRVA